MKRKKKSLIGWIAKDWRMKFVGYTGFNTVFISDEITRKKSEIICPVFGIVVPQIKCRITIEEIYYNE